MSVCLHAFECLWACLLYTPDCVCVFVYIQLYTWLVFILSFKFCCTNSNKTTLRNSFTFSSLGKTYIHTRSDAKLLIIKSKMPNYAKQMFTLLRCTTWHKKKESVQWARVNIKRMYSRSLHAANRVNKEYSTNLVIAVWMCMADLL